MFDNLIEISCPQCNHSIAFSSSDAGARGKCPYCDMHFIIPSGSANSQTIHALSASRIPPPRPPSYASAKLYTLSNPKEYRNFAWRRWSARAIDGFIGCLILSLLFTALHLICNHYQLRFLTEFFYVALQYICLSVFIDSFLISTLFYALLGTTPGKKICGLAVCDSSGNTPSPMQFFKRELRVWLKGLWLAIPPLALIPLIIQYRKCSKGFLASYDSDHQFQCRPIRGKMWIDIVVVVALFILIYFFNTYSSSSNILIPPAVNAATRMSDVVRQPTEEDVAQLFIEDACTYKAWHGFSLYNGTSNFVLKTIRVMQSYSDNKHIEIYQFDVNIPPMSVFNSPFSVFVRSESFVKWDLVYADGVYLK